MATRQSARPKVSAEVRRLERSGVGRGRPARSEAVARSRPLDQPSDQAATAHRQRREHEATGIAPDVLLGGGPVVRLLLRKTPDLSGHGLASFLYPGHG